MAKIQHVCGQIPVFLFIELFFRLPAEKAPVSTGQADKFMTCQNLEMSANFLFVSRELLVVKLYFFLTIEKEENKTNLEKIKDEWLNLENTTMTWKMEGKTFKSD